jgi:hypothetical protein
VLLADEIVKLYLQGHSYTHIADTLYVSPSHVGNVCRAYGISKCSLSLVNCIWRKCHNVPDSTCVNWSGLLHNNIPVMRHNKKSVNVRRVLYADMHCSGEPLTPELRIKRTCSNPQCVNVDHMYTVSYRKSHDVPTL